MRLYVNETTGDLWRVTTGKSTFSLAAVVGSREPVELQFGKTNPDSGAFVANLLDDPTGIIVGLKADGIYDGDFITSLSAFTPPGDVTGFYTGTLSYDTDPARELLNVDGNPLNDKRATLLTLQVDHRANGSSSPAKSNPIALVLNNSVIQGDEGATDPANPSFPAWNEVATVKTAIVGLTGGGGTKLDGQTTAGGVAPQVLILPNVRPAPVNWQQILSATIATSSVANPSIITTTAEHNIPNGATVAIGGHLGSVPDINGDHVATVLSPTTFSIPVNVTTGGAGGKVTPATNTAGGIVRPTDFDAANNARTWQSF